MPSTFTRRRLLAAGATVCLAESSGCLDAIRGATGSDGGGGSATGDRRLRLSLSRRSGSLADRYVTDLEATRPDWDEEAFAAAVAGETYTTQFREPFFARENPKYAKREGTYYRLGSVVVGEREATHPVLRLRTVGSPDELDSVPDHAAYDELHEADRRAVSIAYKAARARGNVGGVPWGLVERGGYVYRSDEAVGASNLVGDSGPSHVEYRGTIYRVEVSRETFHEPVYRAEVEPVAESSDEMEAVLRARFVDARFGRGDLSKTERSILRDARSREGYAERHPYSEAYRSVLKRLHRRAYIDGNVRKDAFAEPDRPPLVLYDGEYYEYRLRFVTND
ncbi:hypothetical protein M0R88_12920 [Halorussus gelatinilyticus]|uniref:Uncharacterized protein n=1 Tax=Halorussus gelatinilyticus TaxID=2937524 RepID=A0A8U0IEN2_9EURY|nr:hypothetical protein [Halorussus gelatinilyticus]UPV99422.1 hypothetical protein M0R88_12920 [Halorussus gelatinilyticus]